MSIGLIRSSLVVGLFIVSSSACAPPPLIPHYAPGVGRPASMTVTSPAFNDASPIPVDFTCDGTDVMPALTFSAAPATAKSLVLYVEDPDASSGTFTHLLLFNLSPELSKLPSASDVTAGGESARVGLNDFGAVRYNGPCPPKGEGHRYRFRIVALDTMLTLNEGATRSQVDHATDGHILGEGALVGHFSH